MKRITIVMALTIFPAFIAYGEFRKWQLDREVDRLCAIDGGIHIYEQVRLPKESFGPDGGVFPRYRHLLPQGGELGPDFYSKSQQDILMSGSPSLVRSQIEIIRRTDNKVIARRINYMRGGGDIPGPWAPSSHQCDQVLDPKRQLNAVFQPEE